MEKGQAELTHDEAVFSLERALYEQVGNTHVDLSAHAQQATINAIGVALHQYKRYFLQTPELRDLIIKEWNSRHSGKNSNKSVAKMGADFNTSIQGHNAKVANRINSAMKVCLFEYKSHYAVTERMMEANFHPRLFFSHEIYYRIKLGEEVYFTKIYRKMRILYSGIYKRRERLVRSILKTLAELSLHKAKSLTGDVMTASDLLQQGIIAAFESTLSYSPDSGASWVTYAYAKADRVMSKYAAESSRTVAIPRSIQDRYSPVLAAIRKIGTSDFESIALLSNKINAERKKASVGRKLRRNELYTAEEVEKLLQVVHNTVSLEMPVVNEEEPNEPSTLGEMLPADSPIELGAEYAILKRNLAGRLQELLSPTEWGIMSIRWGLVDGVPKGLNETATIWKENHDTPTLNKGKIKDLEQTIFNRIRDDIKLMEMWEASEELSTRRI